MKISEMSRLKEPFAESDIEWRLQSCGKARDGKIWARPLAYITSRAVQERLDEVCGPDGWQTSITKQGDAYLCTLSVRVEHDDGSTEWISRTDGADCTDIEAVKGGISGAIKRSAVLFGVGRYLYKLKDSWADITENGRFSGQTKEKDRFKWNPPKLPDWALPTNSTETEHSTKHKENQDNSADLKTQCKNYESIKDSLIDFMESGILSSDEAEKTKKSIDAKNIVAMEQILNCCVARQQKQEA